MPQQLLQLMMISSQEMNLLVSYFSVELLHYPFCDDDAYAYGDDDAFLSNLSFRSSTLCRL